MRVQSNEKGMASLAVTTVLILVISLIIIGFSQVARRNQRETLDRQLSTQAYYAAESGVNKAVAMIRGKVMSGSLPNDKTSCGPDANYPGVHQLNGEDVEITCLLVSTRVNDLEYTGVGENAPTVVPIVAENGAVINRLVLTWRNPIGGTTPSSTCLPSGGAYTLTSKTSWSCGHGMLRTDLTTAPSGDATDRAISTFFYPHQRATVNATTAPQIPLSQNGGLVEGYCSDAGGDPKCMAVITGLDAPVYYMSLRSIYRTSSVTIEAQTVGGASVRLIGQALIDVTARSQDVLRRIQVRVPLEAREESGIPAHAIQSTSSICKRYSVYPAYYNQDPAVTCN